MSNPVQEAMAQVIAKSWEDPAYKKQLLADPKGTLAKAGILFPDGHNVQIHESDANNTHICLPPKPANVGTDEELKEAAEPSAAQLICVGAHMGTSDLICVGPKEAGTSGEGLICVEANDDTKSPEGLICVKK